MYEKDWTKPTIEELESWTNRAVPYLQRLNIKLNYPYFQKYGPKADTFQWKVTFIFDNMVLKNHNHESLDLIKPLSSQTTHQVSKMVSKMVSILSHFMEEIPISKGDRGFTFKRNLLFNERAHALVLNNKPELNDLFCRLNDQYISLTSSKDPEETKKLVEKRAAKNEKLKKKAFKKRFSSKEEEVLNTFAQFAIQTHTDDNLPALKSLIMIVQSDLLDDLVRFRSANRTNLKYLDENRLMEACKLALCKKMIDQ